MSQDAVLLKKYSSEELTQLLYSVSIQCYLATVGGHDNLPAFIHHIIAADKSSNVNT